MMVTMAIMCTVRLDMLSSTQKRIIHQLVMYNPTSKPTDMVEDVLQHASITNFGRLLVMFYFIKCMIWSYPMHTPLILLCMVKIYTKKAWAKMRLVLSSTHHGLDKTSKRLI